jgi:anti-anti-sigma factor
MLVSMVSNAGQEGPPGMGGEVVGDMAVVRPVGAVDTSNAGELGVRALHLLRTPGIRHTVFDASGVSFIDAAGMAVIVKLADLAAKRGGTLTVWHPNAQMQRVMQVTGVPEGVIVVHPPKPEREPRSRWLASLRLRSAVRDRAPAPPSTPMAQPVG